MKVNIPYTADGVKLAGINAGGAVNANTIVYNDIYSDESRELLLHLQLPALATTSAGSSNLEPQQALLAEVTIEYVDPATGTEVVTMLPVTITRLAVAPSADTVQSPDPMVLATAARYETASTIRKAQELGEVCFILQGWGEG